MRGFSTIQSLLERLTKSLYLIKRKSASKVGYLSIKVRDLSINADKYKSKFAKINRYDDIILSTYLLICIVDKLAFQVLIGKRIKCLRQERLLSQRQLSFICNKDPQSLERVENGKSCATIFYLNEICIGLEISLEEFFRGM